jgi:phage protein D
MTISTKPVVLIADVQGNVLFDLRERLLSFEFDDSDEKVDTMKMVLRNEDLQLQEHPALAPGSLIRVSWGYAGFMSSPRTVLMGRGKGRKKNEAKGFKNIEVSARGGAVGLDRKAKSRTWTGLRKSDVVESIAREYGFTNAGLYIEDTESVRESITQPGITDAKFLKRLAKQEGFIFYVDETGFHWHPRRFDTEVKRIYDLTLSGAVLDVKWDSNLWPSPAKTSRRGVNPNKGQAQTDTVTDGDGAGDAALAGHVMVADPDDPQVASRYFAASVANDALPGFAADFVNAAAGATGPALGWTAAAAVESGTVPGLLLRDEIIPVASAETGEETRRARARYRNSSRRRFEVDLTLVGDPALRAKSVVSLVNFGSMLSGKYYAKNVRHIISNGYKCQVKLKRGNAKRSPGRTAKRTQEPVNERPDPFAGESFFESPEAAAAFGMSYLPEQSEAGTDEQGKSVLHWK